MLEKHSSTGRLSPRVLGGCVELSVHEARQDDRIDSNIWRGIASRTRRMHRLSRTSTSSRRPRARHQLLEDVQP